MSVEELAKQALLLPAEQRYALATRIWDSLEEEFARTEPMSDDVRAAAAEAMRRDAELTSGAVEGIPHEEVMAEIRRIIACE